MRDCTDCALLAAGFTLREIRGVEVWARPVEPVRPLPRVRPTRSLWSRLWLSGW